MAEGEKEVGGGKAELGGVELNAVSIEDAFSKDIVRYEFPFANGALLDDLGEKARTLLIKCHFFGSDYGNHAKLAGLIAMKGPLRFVHPKYGVIEGAIEAVTIRHDDRVRSAEAEVRFVEESVSEQSVTEAGRADSGSAEKEFAKGRKESEEAIKDSAPDGASAVMSQELDPDKGMLEQLSGITGPAWKYLASVESFTARLESAMTAVENPANTLITAIDYGRNAPGRIASAIDRCAERYAVLNEKAGASPSGRIGAVRAGMDEAEALAPPELKRHVRAGGALRAGLELDGIFAGELQKRRLLKRLEGRRGFDSLGQRIAENADADIMSSDEIEKALFCARDYISSALSVNRDMESLRAMSGILLRRASDAILQLETVRKTEAPYPIPLHRLCLDNGLPYTAGPRTLALNPSARNPNMLTGEVRVYAG